MISYYHSCKRLNNILHKGNRVNLFSIRRHRNTEIEVKSYWNSLLLGITGFPCQTSVLPYCRLNQRYKSDVCKAHGTISGVDMIPWLVQLLYNRLSWIGISGFSVLRSACWGCFDWHACKNTLLIFSILQVYFP